MALGHAPSHANSELKKKKRQTDENLIFIGWNITIFVIKLSRNIYSHHIYRAVGILNVTCLIGTQTKQTAACIKVTLN